MPNGTKRVVKSLSNGHLIREAVNFLAGHEQAVLLTHSHLAGEGVAHSISGRRGLHRPTLIQFAADLARPEMARQGWAPLTALGAEAIASRVVYAALAEKELRYFERVATTPGFARSVARSIQELRLARADAVKLAEAGDAGADLARLLRRYESELATRRLADLARVLELATECARTGTHRWLGLPLTVLDVAPESAAHQELLDAILARASDVFLGEIDEDAKAEDQPAATLDHLRRYLFDPEPRRAKDAGGFEIFSAPGEGLEAVEIARRILRLARGGATFDQAAILLRNPERQQPAVEEALRRARIPAYFSRGTVRPDPGGRAFLALLACAADGCSASRFAEYLSLGQVPSPDASPKEEWIGADDEMLAQQAERMEVTEPAVDESKVPRAPAYWEKLLVDAAVIGGKDRWKRRLAGLDREFELRLKTLEREDETSRAHLERQMRHLRELEKFALPLIERLDALRCTMLWGDWIAELSDLARAALRRPEPVLAVLAEFEPMADVGPVSIGEVRDVLGERLGFLRRDPPARRYGHVFVGSIEEARGREFGVVFLPGLAEGLFPQKALEDPLLLDEARRRVSPALKLRDDRVGEERMRLRLAVAAARDLLVASYPRMEIAEARARVPSFYALELPRAIEGRLPELEEFEKRARDAAPARLNWPAPSRAAEAIDETEYDLTMLKPGGARASARYLLETNEHLARSLRGRWKRWEKKWTNSDGLIASGRPALDVLETFRLKARAWSPSALQNFAVCPYKFAVSGIFGLRPRDEAAPIEQLDSLTRGGLFHEVQFTVLSELRERGMLPVNSINLADVARIADEVHDRVAEKYREDLAPAIERVWETQIEDLRTDVRGWLQHIATNDEDWLPVHFEFAFGLKRDEHRDAASTDADADLEGVRLRGSIDLVERHMERGVYRVTDHKTGKLPETIPGCVGGGKFLQPVLYGLAVEQLLGAQVESGRLFYSTQQGGYQYIPIQLNPSARLFMGKLLGNIDESIASGFLPPIPQKDACGWCDYRTLCGPYEDQRAARHKDMRDERIELLTEIRAML